MAEVRTLRVGLLGYGLAGRVFHAPLIATTPGMEVAAIVTADPERAAGARRDFPAARVLDRADALWAMADRLDLAVVATPNRFHVPLALAAIDAGLAVVVDKPFAPSAAEGRRVIDRAAEAGIPLTVFQNRRWDGDYLTLRGLLTSGELGSVFRFESRFERWQPESERSWRESGDPVEVGGLLFDLGSHLVDQAVQLFGPVTSVYAELDDRRPGAEIDDDAFVALTHASGVRSQLWMSAVAGQLGPRFRVLCEHGAFVKYGLDVQEETLDAGARPGDPGFGEEPPERWGTLGAAGSVRTLPTERGRYDAFYAGVAEALRDGSPMPVDPADSVEVLAILEDAVRSATERTVVLR